jgi:hypothetical protein
MAAIVGWLCGPWKASQFTRNQFEHIRMGMSPSEVASVMGCRPMGTPSNDLMRLMEVDAGDSLKILGPTVRLDCWWDDAAIVAASYNVRGVNSKSLYVRVPRWRLLLDWLRHRVGVGEWYNPPSYNAR